MSSYFFNILITLLLLVEATHAQVDVNNIKFETTDVSRSLELVQDLDLLPKKTIVFDSAKVHISRPFKFNMNEPDYGNPEYRYAYIGYVELSNGELIPRLFYRSNSHGIFKLAPFINVYNYAADKYSLTWFSKGIGENSVSLPAKIQKHLLVGASSKELDVLKLTSLINIVNTFIDKGSDEKKFESYNSRIKSNMKTEVSFTDKIIQEGDQTSITFKYKGKDRTDIFYEPQSIRLKNENLYPEYKNGPDYFFDFELEHYGKVKGEVFKSKDKTLEYLVIKNSEGKIWIASMNFVGKSSPMTSYGVRALTLKTKYTPYLIPLWERKKYIHPNFKSQQKIPRDGHYESAWRYLSKMPLIKRYYTEQGLTIPEDVSKNNCQDLVISIVRQ